MSASEADTTSPDRMLVAEIEAILSLWGSTLSKEQSLLNNAARELKILRKDADLLVKKLTRAEDYIAYIVKMLPAGKPPRPYGHNPVS